MKPKSSYLSLVTSILLIFLFACGGSNFVDAAVKITTLALPDATVGQLYSTVLDARGGPAPYQWSLAAGTLPSGISLSSSGLLSGTPAAPVTVTPTLQVKDKNGATNSKQLSLTVQPSVQVLQIGVLTATPLTLSFGDVVYGIPSAPQVFTIKNTGTAAATISGVVASANYVIGPNTCASATLAVGASCTVSITFTAPGVGTYSGTLQITSNAQNSTYTLGMTGNGVAPLQITTTTLPHAECTQINNPDGTFNHWQTSAYSYQLTATGGVLPYTWSITSGQLPAGITLSADGLISGTPDCTAIFGTPTP